MMASTLYKYLSIQTQSYYKQRGTVRKRNMDSREIIRRNIAPLQFEAGAAGEDKKPRDLKKSFSLPELSMNLTYIIRWLGRVRKYSGLGKVLKIYGYFQICAGGKERDHEKFRIFYLFDTFPQKESGRWDSTIPDTTLSILSPRFQNT